MVQFFADKIDRRLGEDRRLLRGRCGVTAATATGTEPLLFEEKRKEEKPADRTTEEIWARLKPGEWKAEKIGSAVKEISTVI